MRRRWVKVLTIVVVVLAVLGVTADRVAVHYANQEAATLARQKYGYGADTTDGYLNVSINGFPFLTQVLSGQLDDVTLSAGNLVLNSRANAQGDYLDVQKLDLDLHGVTVTSLTARSAQVDLVTGDLTLTYQALSGVITRLMSNGGPLTVGPAPGSDGQQARFRVTGTWGGRQVDTVGSLLAQGAEIDISVPGVGSSGGSNSGSSTSAETTGPGTYVWGVQLPVNATFSAATGTPTGVDLSVIGHQVVLGSYPSAG